MPKKISDVTPYQPIADKVHRAVQGKSAKPDADHTVTITTTDGDTHTVRATADDAPYYDDLPFTSSNVAATTITKP
jgi:hypothetical protein